MKNSKIVAIFVKNLGIEILFLYFYSSNLTFPMKNQWFFANNTQFTAWLQLDINFVSPILQFYITLNVTSSSYNYLKNPVSILPSALSIHLNSNKFINLNNLTKYIKYRWRREKKDLRFTLKTNKYAIGREVKDCEGEWPVKLRN